MSRKRQHTGESVRPALERPGSECAGLWEGPSLAVRSCSFLPTRNSQSSPGDILLRGTQFPESPFWLELTNHHHCPSPSPALRIPGPSPLTFWPLVATPERGQGGCQCRRSQGSRLLSRHHLFTFTTGPPSSGCSFLILGLPQMSPGGSWGKIQSKTKAFLSEVIKSVSSKTHVNFRYVLSCEGAP